MTIVDYFILGTLIGLMVSSAAFSIHSFMIFRKIKKYSEDLQKLDGLREFLVQQSSLYISEVRELKENFWEAHDKLKDRIDELRLQLGIINGQVSRMIHISYEPTKPEKIPYTGAKRGPKPKNKINNE